MYNTQKEKTRNNKNKTNLSSFIPEGIRAKSVPDILENLGGKILTVFSKYFLNK